APLERSCSAVACPEFFLRRRLLVLVSHFRLMENGPNFWEFAREWLLCLEEMPWPCGSGRNAGARNALFRTCATTLWKALSGVSSENFRLVKRSLQSQETPRTCFHGRT